MSDSRPIGVPIVLVHGGTPGISPYCAGAHLWSRVLPRFAGGRASAIDLPGYAARTPDADKLSVDVLIEHTRARIEQNHAVPVHLVGHDLGGLVALRVAIEAPELVRSCVVVNSLAAAPTGDSVENPTLAHPPRPMWSRESQAWALERLSYAPCHVDSELLDACDSAADADGHRWAVRHAEAGGHEQVFLPSLYRNKARLFAHLRDAGLPVPAQLVWSTHDPLTSTAQGFVLFKLIAERQAATQFHVMNRAGTFPYRENPESFHHIVTSFIESAVPASGA